MTLFRFSVLECICHFKGRNLKRGRGKRENGSGEVSKLMRLLSGGGRRPCDQEPSVEIISEGQQDTSSSETEDKEESQGQRRPDGG